jgi:hypothetical protein
MPLSKSILAGAAPTACVALGLFLGGCDSADHNPATPEASTPIGTTDLTGSSDFDRDLIAAKTVAATNAERLSAIEAVLSKYGIPHSAPQAPEAQPGPVLPQAAAKTAATFLPVVRDFTAGNGYTFYMDITVKPSKTLWVEAIATTANADPYLVAFFRDDASDNQSAYALKFVAADDDVASDNRNSLISWKNTGSSNKTVTVMAFNYSPANGGTADINVVNGGTNTSYPERWLGGTVVYGSNPIPAVPAGCAPFFTRVIERNRFGGGFHGAALVMDFNAMKGGIIWDDPSTNSQSLDFMPLLGNPYPSFAMLFQASGKAASSGGQESSGYAYTQEDHYLCR